MEWKLSQKSFFKGHVSNVHERKKYFLTDKHQKMKKSCFRYGKNVFKTVVKPNVY